MTKGFGRTFGQDLMRGEHVVGGGQPVSHPAVPGRKTSGLAESSAYTPAARGNTRANAQVSGGGGGGWAALNEQMAASRAKLTGVETEATGTSIFDPVLCELTYRWFCPAAGTILDPFAGGSVRGIVASKLGFQYIGVELRHEQVAANMAQGIALCGVPVPRWVEGDSRQVLPHMAGGDEPVAADLIFSCPPYADLEVYSDHPNDISNMPYAKFREAYGEIIAGACALLKPNRFACFVVGDARGKDGNYYGLPWHTVDAFERAGLRLYNESVLVTAIGSLPIRITKQFNSGRKLGKTHQNIFVFVKGDGKKAAQACGGKDGN